MPGNDLVPMLSIWDKVSEKSGDEYGAGSPDRNSFEQAVEILRAGGRVLIFKRKKKDGDRGPDRVVYAVAKNG